MALIGTERRPLPPTVANDLGVMLDVLLEQATDEQTVLTAAGALAAYQRAGLCLAHSGEPSPPPAPPDERTEAPPGATQLLSLLLDGQVRLLGNSTALVAEWLERCARNGFQLPPRLLPSLLDLGRRQTAVRGPLLAAAGDRARWLASRNPTWSWATRGYHHGTTQSGNTQPDSASTGPGPGTDDGKVWAAAGEELEKCADDKLAAFLLGLPRPWPASLTSQAIDQLRTRQSRKRALTLQSVRLTLNSVAWHGHPEAIGEIERWMEHEKNTTLQNHLREVAHTFSFRKAIAHELP